MAALSKSDMKHDPCTCTVEVLPHEVDAGADITLKVRVAGLRRSAGGPRVSIRDDDGVELASVTLAKLDGEVHEADDIVLTAPPVAGEHIYRLVVVAADKDGALHEQASTEARFVVTPHAAQLNVWDVPSAIVAGERFKFKVGIRCSAGCDLSGRELNIVDRDGLKTSTASLGREIWPDTDALYFAEMEAEAPPAAGDYQWEVSTAAWCSELPHAAGSFGFGLKVVNLPDCEVTVEAFDREKQTPLEGAHVVMHPYRAVTDENGVAKLKVTKGQYDILVSGSKYVPACTSVEVVGDMTTRAELDLEPPWTSPDEAL